MTTNENGITIKCENCERWTKACSLRESDMDKGYLCSIMAFKPSVNAFKALIAKLQNTLNETAKLLEEKSFECGRLQARKPQAKRLEWEDERVGYEYRAYSRFNGFYLKILPNGNFRPFCLSFGSDNENYKGDDANIAEGDTVEYLKEAAQEWLDKFVEDCAEYESNYQQKQVSTTNGTSESEVEK